MQQCAEHLSFQLPNEHTRVGYLLEGIQSMDPGLQAAMASVKMDDGPNGMRNDFKAAAANLLPYDPVAKKKAAMKRPVAQISSVEEVDEISGTVVMKESIGKTGVHLRWHMNAEYKELTSEQKKELSKWRERNPNTKKGKERRHKKQRGPSKKQISAVVAKELKKLVGKKAKEDSNEADAEAYIQAMIQAAIAKSSNDTREGEESRKSHVSLKSILK